MNIHQPTFLVDKAKCLQNIGKMVKKAVASEVELRPHFKTHISAEIGSWFRSFDISKCTVSSASMAVYFAKHGWEDITIAFPYNPLQSDQISDLAGKVTINILLESEESMAHAKAQISNPVGFFIKIDVGHHRTGIDPRNESLIQSLISNATENLQFKGFLAHAGHTYGSSDSNNIQWIFEGSQKTLTSLAKRFGGIISYGDTPSCSILENFTSLDEIRPGNFVFYDWMQYSLGSCSFNEIAVCLATPIVAVHSERGEVVVYGGAVHLSKDRIIESDPLGKPRVCFGKAVRLTSDGWEPEIIGHVDRLSQEHGVIKMDQDILVDMHVGDLIGIVPVHSCLSADLQGHYLSTSGQVIEKMRKI